MNIGGLVETTVKQARSKERERKKMFHVVVNDEDAENVMGGILEVRGPRGPVFKAY